VLSPAFPMQACLEHAKHGPGQNVHNPPGRSAGVSRPWSNPLLDIGPKMLAAGLELEELSRRGGTPKGGRVIDAWAYDTGPCA
jgi:hypothetical protein